MCVYWIHLEPSSNVVQSISITRFTLKTEYIRLIPDSGYFSPQDAEAKSNVSPPLTKALKMIDSKPMMRLSDDYFAKKTGFAKDADSSSKTVVEKPIPTLNSKTVEPSKKLSYSRYTKSRLL